MKLKGKCALVTGAGRGIGKAIAFRYLEEGATVMVNARNEDYYNEMLKDIKPEDRDRLIFHKADVSYKDQVEGMFNAAMGKMGRLDILVNNAAWVNCIKHFLDYDENFWDEVVRNNLKSVYLTCFEASKIMAAQGGGNIINLSSIGSVKAHREMVAYDACKGGVDAMTRALALEMAPWNIRVNAISPAAILGVTVGKINDSVLKKRDPKDFETPILRQGIPEDVSGLAVFLASDDSDFITGQIIAVDGGLGVQARRYWSSSVTPENWKGRSEKS